MIALLCFVLAVLAAPFRSKGRLEAENAALRHQLIILRRKVQGRARLTNKDRWFFILSFPKISSVQIRAMRQNQRIIRRDACDPPFARDVRRRHVQVAPQA